VWKGSGVAPLDLATLSLDELAHETGVPAATIAAWERAYGFPEPVRELDGRVAYPRDAVRQVMHAARVHAEGAPLVEAIADAVHSVAPWRPVEPSVFAAVREGLGGVVVRTMTKRSLLAVTWAIEDECAERAIAPLLVGAFQTRRFFDRAADRWVALAARARSTCVLATGSDPGIDGVAWIDLAPDAPMSREWSVVCDAVDRPALLTAWELPGQEGVPDLQRRFEAVWTLDPATVRRATRVAASIALKAGAPGAADLVADVSGPPVVARQDHWAADRFHHRVVAYADRIAAHP
jgi:DICT domain-containing protein/predicted DNA-binding transcriptional regulator AlpA